MSIKKLIGQRIQSERKARGLTQAKLAELAGGFKQPRINNWEQGVRTPGPEEIKQVAHVLDVSPAFLMGLTDRKQIHTLDKSHVGALVPLLRPEQCDEAKIWIKAIKTDEYDGEVVLIPLDLEIAKMAGENAFMFKMEDDSMEPELRCHDLLLINPNYPVKPGNLVVAKSEESSEIIVRRYKRISISKTAEEFELLANNTHWPNIQGSSTSECKILGTVVYLHRPMISHNSL